MVGKILNSAGEATLVVEEILVSELRIKVVDCRTNQLMKNAQVSRVRISNGAQTIEREFDREKDVQNIDRSDTIKGSMLALQKLGYETEEKATEREKLPSKYDDTWRGYYNQYWSDRIPDFEELTEGNPYETMMIYMIDEYNNHRATDGKGLLRLRIPNALLDDKEVTAEVGFFNFPVVLERVKNDDRATSVLRNSDSTDAETGFRLKWNQENRQSISWKGNFGWIIHNRNDTSEFKYSEEFTVKDNTDKFEKFDSDSCSKFYDETIIDSPHYILFALQWCQPIYDFIDDPDPSTGQRCNDKAFVNMKEETGENSKWINGLNMHIPSKHDDKSGPYYGFFSMGNQIHPRGREHSGVDLYSGLNGDAPLFSVYAGEVKAHHGSGYGYRAYLLFGKIGDPCFHYTHLASAVSPKKWVMAGTKIGTCGRTYCKDGLDNYPNNEPSHVHLEFIRKANKTTPPIVSTTSEKKEEFIKVRDITLPENSKYDKPEGANAFLFQGNKLPLILPCESTYGSTQTVESCQCKADKTTWSSKLGKTVPIFRTCYGIGQYPYENNLLLPSVSRLKSSDLSPASVSKIVRFICPNLVKDSACKRLQLQAKIKFIYVNYKNLIVNLSIPTGGSQSILDSYFDFTLDIDGVIGADTRNSIKRLVQAHYYSTTGASLKEDDKKVNDDKMQAIVDKYIENKSFPGSDENYNIVVTFYNWFNSIDITELSYTK